MTKKTPQKRRSKRAPAVPAAVRQAQSAASQGPSIDLSVQQVVVAANAGLRLLGLETTLLPGNLRQQLAVLEVILQGISGGRLLLVPRAQVAVESGPNAGQPAD